MINNLDYIYVPKADINEGVSKGTITKAELYFTKEYLFVLPFESLQVLLAGMETKNNNKNDYWGNINIQIPNLDINSFHNLMLGMLKPERIYRISELEIFLIQVGFWILGGIRIRKKGGELQTFNVQPSALRKEIKKFYGLV